MIVDEVVPVGLEYFIADGAFQDTDIRAILYTQLDNFAFEVGLVKQHAHCALLALILVEKYCFKNVLSVLERFASCRIGEQQLFILVKNEDRVRRLIR